MIRKSISMLVVMLMALMTLVPAQSFADTCMDFTGEAARVSTPSANGRVNLRKSASNSGAVITTLVNSTSLVIHGKSGNWYKVCDIYTGFTGYMYKTYVAKTFQAIASGNVNLRRGAGTNYGVIQVIKKDVKLTVYQMGKSFSKVKSGSSIGWISNKYLYTGC